MVHAAYPQVVLELIQEVACWQERCPSCREAHASRSHPCSVLTTRRVLRHPELLWNSQRLTEKHGKVQPLTLTNDNGSLCHYDREAPRSAAVWAGWLGVRCRNRNLVLLQMMASHHGGKEKVPLHWQGMLSKSWWLGIFMELDNQESLYQSPRDHLVQPNAWTMRWNQLWGPFHFNILQFFNRACYNRHFQG